MELLIFILGLFFGSFFGVVIDRIPKDKGIIGGRSHCEFCKKELKWYDLIPIISFLFLGGRCRYCKKKLSIFYPIIELSTGVLFTFVFLVFIQQGLIAFFYNLVILSSFLLIFFMDLKYGIIPDRIIFPAGLISILYNTLFQKNSLLNHSLSAILAFLFFFLISYLFYAVTKKQGMGGGDIKLSFLLGLFLGFPNIVISLYIAFLTGALASIILVLWEKKRFLKDSLPFGPFLILGVFISLFFGEQIYSYVLSIFGV